jgi:hypothetical protein
MENEERDKEQEVQEWLDQVHFGSCCSDSPPDEEDEIKETDSDLESQENE